VKCFGAPLLPCSPQTNIVSVFATTKNNRNNTNTSRLNVLPVGSMYQYARAPVMCPAGYYCPLGQVMLDDADIHCFIPMMHIIESNLLWMDG
jgi:hypothetical protein